MKDNSVTVRWSPAQGPVKGYKVTGAPRYGGGTAFTEVVAPGVTFTLFHIEKLCVSSHLSHFTRHLSQMKKACVLSYSYFRPDRVYFLRTDARRRVRF